MSIQRSTIRSDAQNLVNDTGTGIFSSSEWNTAIDDGARDIRRVLLDTGRESFWIKSAAIASLVTATDFEMNRFIRNDRTSGTATVLGEYYPISAASLGVGATIKIAEGSSTLTNATQEYIRLFTAMTQDTDTPDLPDGFHYLCKNAAAVRYYLKGGNDPEFINSTKQATIVARALGVDAKTILEVMGISVGGK